MKRVGRQSVVYGFGILLSKAIAFIMLPVYTRFLTPGDYGTLELIEMTLDVISIIAGGRLASGIFRYYHKAESDEERKAVVSTAQTILALTYLCVGAFAFTAAPFLSKLVFQSDAYTSLIRIAAGSLAFQSLFIAPLAYIRVKERPAAFVMANLAKLVAALSLNILFVVHYHMGARGVLLSNLISSGVIGVALAVYALREVGLHWSQRAVRDLVRFCAPLVAMQMATFIATFGDRYFLQRVSNTTAVGIYTLAYQFGFMLGAIGYMPFELMWDPVKFSVAKRADKDAIFARMFIYLNVLLLSTAVFLILFIPDILHVMTTSPFYPAAILVPAILLAYVLQGWCSMSEVGIYVRERTEYLMLGTWLSAITALVGYAILIPRYYGLGAALATFASFFVRWATSYIFSQRLWRVEYRWAPIIRQIVLGAIVCTLGWFLAPQTTIVGSVAIHSVFFAIYMAGLWFLVLSAEDRALAVQGVRRARAFLSARRMAAELS